MCCLWHPFKTAWNTSLVAWVIGDASRATVSQQLCIWLFKGSSKGSGRSDAGYGMQGPVAPYGRPPMPHNHYPASNYAQPPMRPLHGATHYPPRAMQGHPPFRQVRPISLPPWYCSELLWAFQIWENAELLYYQTICPQQGRSVSMAHFQICRITHNHARHRMVNSLPGWEEGDDCLSSSC